MIGDNTQLTELIDRYYEGTLSQEEKLAFEKRLADEVTFAQEVALHKKIVAGLKASSRGNMLKKLQEEDAKMEAYQPVAKTIPLYGGSSQKLYWAIAAGFILLLIPFVILYNQRQSSEQLFTQYFAPYSHQEGALPTDGPADQAMDLYKNQNYAQALPILDKMLGGKEGKEAAILFYKGNSHLALDHAEDAINSFEGVLALSPNPYTEEAEWYLALSYVKAAKKRKAKKLLEDIIKKQDHPYQKEARDLLTQL